ARALAALVSPLELARRDRPRQRLEVALEAHAPACLRAAIAAVERVRELAEAGEERIPAVAQVRRRSHHPAHVEGADARIAADVVRRAVARPVQVAALAG